LANTMYCTLKHVGKVKWNMSAYFSAHNAACCPKLDNPSIKA